MLSIVLPAYNEGQTLPSLLERILKTFGQSDLERRVIVINDGSTDETGTVARNYLGELPLELIEWHPNRGYAEALRQGLAHALRDARQGDVIITMDADNSHPPELIPDMLAKLSEGNDVVIASRFQKGGAVRGVPVKRRVLSHGASDLLRLLAPIRGVRDYTCGYRAYDAMLLSRVFDRFGDDLIKQEGFGCTLELLLRIQALNPTISEVPLVLRYDLKLSESKMKIWPTILSTLGLLHRHSSLGSLVTWRQRRQGR